MDITPFTSLGRKLEALELSSEETALLDLILTRAEQFEQETAGFGMLDLGLAPRPLSVVANPRRLFDSVGGNVNSLSSDEQLPGRTDGGPKR